MGATSTRDRFPDRGARCNTAKNQAADPFDSTIDFDRLTKQA